MSDQPDFNWIVPYEAVQRDSGWIIPFGNGAGALLAALEAQKEIRERTGRSLDVATSNLDEWHIELPDAR